MNIQKIIKRKNTLEGWIRENCPQITKDQKHLNNGEARNYWHYGYLMALKDILNKLAK
mgnify:CR=1 FL=1